MAYNPRKDTEQVFQQDTGLPGSALPPGPGYVLDLNGKVVVGNDTYYPSTTNGKLDLFSKTVAVENAPAPAANTVQDSPFAVVDQQANTLKQRFAEQFKRLQGQNLSPEQHNKILAGMQADYDNEKYKLSDVKTQLDGIKSAVESGAVDPAMGQSTMWRIVAPHMAGAFKPPAQEPRGRMTPGEMTALGKKFIESRDRAYVAPWMSKNYYDPEKLKQEYLTDRTTYGYDDQMNTGEKKAFDIQWDAIIAAKPAADKVWKDLLANDPDLMTSRPYDSQLLGVASQKVTGKRVSPFAQGINTPAEGTKAADNSVNSLTGRSNNYRNDGSRKDTGYFGKIPIETIKTDEKGFTHSYTGEATEYSIHVVIDGKSVLIPSLVPTLSPEEVNLMKTDIMPYDKHPPEAVVKKATDFAKQRIAAGKSPFFQQGEPLDKATAAALLQEAGGDKNRARQLAKDRGYSF